MQLVMMNGRSFLEERNTMTVVSSSRKDPHKAGARSNSTARRGTSYQPKRVQDHQQTVKDQQTAQERGHLRDRAITWLPTDPNTFVYWVASLLYLIFAAIQCARTGDASMLATILTWVGTERGLTKVKPLLPWGNKGGEPPTTIED